MLAKHKFLKKFSLLKIPCTIRKLWLLYKNLNPNVNLKYELLSWLKFSFLRCPQLVIEFLLLFHSLINDNEKKQFSLNTCTVDISIWIKIFSFYCRNFCLNIIDVSFFTSKKFPEIVILCTHTWRAGFQLLVTYLKQTIHEGTLSLVTQQHDCLCMLCTKYRMIMILHSTSRLEMDG